MSKTSKTTRRTFMKAAGIAAVVAPVAPIILSAADKSGSKDSIIGEGDYKYEAIHGWGELTNHVIWGETHGVAIDRQGLIYVQHRSKVK